MANAALSSIKTATLSIELPFLSEIAALTDGIYNLTESSIYKIVKVRFSICVLHFMLIQY